jgi:hypothetical protein
MSARLIVLLISILNISIVSAQESASGEPDADINIVHFYKKNKLIVVPAIINDTLKVNFIVDPRCKSVVLFGKRFEKLLRPVHGGATGSSKNDHLLLNNKITIGPATTENIAIAIVPNMDPMNFFTSVHGIIGFNMFGNYDISMDKKKQIITFTPTTAQTKLELFPPEVQYH